jgi:ABC-type oligopeptide transport system ATPase subunit
MPAELLRVQNLKVYFPVRAGFFRRKVDDIKAVDDVSFVVPEGGTLGLVGESGSGKSTLARALLKLIPVTAGEALYRGQDILPMSEGRFRPLRKEMQMIFQDPFGSLNPRMSIGEIIAEPLRIHFRHLDKAGRRETVAALLDRVGLPSASLARYPHEFSGGQRQRIGIARALAVQPKFLICDEPVSALDVSVQAQIINLLKDLQKQFGLTYLFIAHDLAVVEYMSDEIIVMHRGKIVESGPAEQICHQPQHDYTRKLLEAVPSL